MEISMKAYLDIIRPLNCIMAGIGALAGCVIAGVPGFSYLVLVKVLLAFTVVFLITGAGNSLNDCYDAEIDKINHPDRPIPSGRLKQKNAMNFAIGLFISGIIISCFLSTGAFLIAVIATLLLGSYEKKLKNKGFTGNIAISILVAFVFIFGGGSLSGNVTGVTTMKIFLNEMKIVLVLAGMAFLANLGREVIKDIEDVEGDTDRVTLPMRIGVKNAGLVVSGAIILSVIISPIPYLLRTFGSIYLGIIGLADAIFIYSIILLDKPGSVSKIIKIGMAVSLIGFIVGGIL